MVVSKLISYLSVKTFKLTDACAGVAVTHDLRKVSEITKSIGMRRVVDEKHMLHNVPVSYFGIKKNWETLCPSEEIRALGQQLFAEVQNAVEFDFNSKNLTAA